LCMGTWFCDLETGKKQRHHALVLLFSHGFVIWRPNENITFFSFHFCNVAKVIHRFLHLAKFGHKQDTKIKMYSIKFVNLMGKQNKT
jgi:hypothetical protein